MKTILAFVAALCFLANAISAEEFLKLSQYTRRFSIFDEEIILAELIKDISEINKFYVDIGANDGIGGSNTAKLALSGWSGIAFDNCKNNIITFSKTYYDVPDVRIFQCVVTPVNVNNLLKAFDTPTNFGVLSLDIDSYDYFVLEALLTSYRPTIIVAEINEKIPPPLKFTVLFDKDHCWNYDHFYGQSISQIEHLCHKKNYAIAKLEYNNVFLVAKEKYKHHHLTALEAYQSGYQLREDRKTKFPYNDNMEILQTSNPEESISFLNHYFSKYAGKYSLEK